MRRKCTLLELEKSDIEITPIRGHCEDSQVERNQKRGNRLSEAQSKLIVSPGNMKF